MSTNHLATGRTTGGSRRSGSGERPPGVLVVAGRSTAWRTSLDLTRILTTAEIVAGAVVVADRLMRRPAAARGRVTVGPGGWVSLKGGSMSLRPAPPPPAAPPGAGKLSPAAALG